MSPYAEGTVAAAQREILKCIAEIRSALKAPKDELWKHVAMAHCHAINVQAQLDHALEIERLAEKQEAAE